MALRASVALCTFLIIVPSVGEGQDLIDFKRGESLFQQGDLLGAVESFKLSIEHNRSHLPSYYSLAEAQIVMAYPSPEYLLEAMKTYESLEAEVYLNDPELERVEEALSRI